MKQSWQKNIDKAFEYHISVNRHVANHMLDYIKQLEARAEDILKADAVEGDQELGCDDENCSMCVALKKLKDLINETR